MKIQIPARTPRDSASVPPNSSRSRPANPSPKKSKDDADARKETARAVREIRAVVSSVSICGKTIVIRSAGTRKQDRKSQLANDKVPQTCAPPGVKLIKSLDGFDRAHAQMDHKSMLVPAAKKIGRQVRVVVASSKPREYPEYYSSGVVQLPSGERVGHSYEEQCHALHERRARLNGIAGIGLTNSPSAGEQAREWLDRLRSERGAAGLDRAIRFSTLSTDRRRP